MWVTKVDGQGEKWSAEPLDGKTTDAFQGRRGLAAQTGGAIVVC